MKKSVEILGLPIISITEGRELGTSKTLLIDAKNRVVAAITIEDDDWYRGVKLIPYESVIAIGEDAVTITHSEHILTLEEATDYEQFLKENIRVIGTKAITKTGRIQGKVTEIFVGEGGRIVKCEITTPEGATDDVDAEQISIFGKQVTVVDIGTEKKNSFVRPSTEPPAFEPVHDNYAETPVQSIWTPPVSEEPKSFSESVEEIPSAPEVPEQPETFDEPDEIQPALEEGMTPEPEVAEEPFTPFTNEPAVEEIPKVEAEENPVDIQTLSDIPVVDEMPTDFNTQPDDNAKIEELTKQANELRAALDATTESSPAPQPETPKVTKSSGGKKIPGGTPIDERRRRVLLGKHATKTIIAESGTIVVESGAEITEEVLQRARLSNKFIELSMNVQ